MSLRCDKCGSHNHAASDCSKPYNGWKEREPVLTLQPPTSAPLPLRERKSEPNQAPEASNSVKTTRLDPVTGRNDHGRSGPLPKRANFPFLRECTRREMDECSARMMAGVSHQSQSKPNFNEKREPVVLQKRTKQVQGGLF